jgi:hypothetical protein
MMVNEKKCTFLGGVRSFPRKSLQNEVKTAVSFLQTPGTQKCHKNWEKFSFFGLLSFN